MHFVKIVDIIGSTTIINNSYEIWTHIEGSELSEFWLAVRSERYAAYITIFPTININNKPLLYNPASPLIHHTLYCVKISCRTSVHHFEKWQLGPPSNRLAGHLINIKFALFSIAFHFQVILIFNVFFQ